jgi:hypothetical protein
MVTIIFFHEIIYALRVPAWDFLRGMAFDTSKPWGLPYIMASFLLL